MMRVALILGLGVALGTLACAPRVVTPPSAATPTLTGTAAGVTKTAAPLATHASEDARLKPLAEDKPVAITSDRLSYTQQGQVTVFQGRVKVVQETTRLDAPYLEVRSQDGQGVARQGIRLVDHARGITVTARELEYKETLSHATVRGNVKVVSHDNENQTLVVKSESMEWNAQGKDIQAKERVVVTYRGSTATAEVMDYSQTTQVAVLSSPGKNAALPKIEQEGDVITGKTLILKTKERIYEARGSARAEIWPKEKNNRAVPGRMKEKP